MSLQQPKACFALPKEESDSLVIARSRMVSARYIYTNTLTSLFLHSLHVGFFLIVCVKDRHTRPLVDRLKQKFEGFALISN